MDTITKSQVCEIMKQVDNDAVASYNLRIGNYNNHCFVTMESGREYVLRISRKGWTKPSWKVGKFMRERVAAELIAEQTGIATPKTHFVDGSLTIIDAVYAVQDRVPGTLFSKVYEHADDGEKIDLLRLFGTTAKTIHEIVLPPMMIWEGFATLRCSHTKVRCLPEDVEHMIEAFGGERISGSDETWCYLEGGLFHRTYYMDASADRFVDEVGKNIKQLCSEGIVDSATTARLEGILHEHLSVIGQELARLHLCHGDYHFSNILVERNASSSNWKVIGLLDLELATAGTPIEEFYKAETYNFPKIEIPHFRRRILEGYGDGINEFRYSLLMLGVMLKIPRFRNRIEELFRRISASEVDDNLKFLNLF